MAPPPALLKPLSSSPEPSRILVRGVNWLGDAVMTTPALARLRERFPQARITLLTHEKLADLWLHHPGLDSILTFVSGARPWSVAQALGREKFDVALVLPNSPRSALEVWLARIPRRIGFVRPWRNLFLSDPVALRPGHVTMRKRTVAEIKRLTQVPMVTEVAGRMPATFVQGKAPRPTLNPDAHQIYDYLHLVAALGANPEPVVPQLAVREDELRAAREKWLTKARTVAGRPLSGQAPLWLGISPSAAYGPAKRWPTQHFAAVVREVSQRKSNCCWLIFGDTRDVGPCQEIEHAAGTRVINLAGQTTLRELMALLKLCRVLLTNDTGPMHVAAALGTRVVVPFGSTSPELTGPGLPGDHHHALLQSGAPCAPCFRRVCPIDLRCLTSIAPLQVADAVCRAIPEA